MEVIELKISDFEPVKFLEKLREEEGVSFLHSGLDEEWTIIAWNPVANFQSSDGLREEFTKRRTGNPFKIPFCGGAIGYFSYDGGLNLNFYDDFLCFDGEKIFTSVPRDVEKIWKNRSEAEVQVPKLNFQPKLSESDYISAFARIKKYILDGDIYQVNLTYQLVSDFDGDHLNLFSKISETNPSSHSAYLDFGDTKILSASPERFLQLRSGRIKTLPVKGTRPRGPGMKEELLASEKEAAELNMITDLLRNDIGQVSEIGSVEVTAHRALQKCPTVWHTYSTVEGTLRSDLHAIDLLRACMPGGSITGCPKKRAMEIIEELENRKRGIYTGAIVYISDCGDMDSSIVIRTLIARDGRLHLDVGGGIVADSDVKGEYRETLDKAKSFLNL